MSRTKSIDTAPLTKRQIKVFTHIYDTARRHGYQPSVPELVELCGVGSHHAIDSDLAALEDAGFISVRGANGRGFARRIAILKRPDGKAFRGFAEK